jgi:hypothetical protein
VLKFSEFLEESRINAYNQTSESTLVAIANAILDKIKSLPRETVLEHIPVVVGYFDIYGFKYKVYVGTNRGRAGRSFVNFSLKKLFIDYSWIKERREESVLDQLAHEIAHIFDESQGYNQEPNRTEDGREFDAFTTQFEYRYLPEIDKEATKQWILRGCNLQEKPLPRIIALYWPHLVTFSFRYYKKFCKRLKNYVINGISKEI